MSQYKQRVHQLHTHVPTLPWRRMWVLALLFCGLALGGEEGFWRYCGFRPSVQDDTLLWAYHYERAASAADRGIVLIGASRINAGVSTSAMSRRFPEHCVVQLARYGGGSPMGTLRRIAQDDRFTGVVVCDFLGPFLRMSNWDDQEHCYAKDFSRAELLEALPGWLGQRCFVVRLRDLAVPKICESVYQNSRLPTPNLVSMHLDRSIALDFTKVANVESLRSRKQKQFRRQYADRPKLSSREMTAAFQEIESLVRQIAQRGGQVVFVRAPSSGQRWQLEERYHSRDACWSRFAHSTSACCLHFRDDARMQTLKCPDGSHLDYRSAEKFTAALIDQLIGEGILKGGRDSQRYFDVRPRS